MYNLNFTITEDLYEIAIAIGYSYDMDGCVEEQFGRHIKLSFYFSQKDNADLTAAALAERLSVNESAIEFIPDDQDWNAKWRESMEPALIADGVWVSPVWLEPPEEGRRVWIKIEPKMAFGTGHHETTRLAARELIARGEAIIGKNVLDIGTGSGILCFIADYLGAKSALGVEIDEDCRENLAENLRDNPPRHNGSVEFVIGTLDSIDIGANQKLDVVIMNMISTESIPLLERIREMAGPGAMLIWSGILADERDEVIEAAKDFGFRLDGCQTENEWWCGTFINER
jgi:ribosomal protein L11 methyltransferase